MTYALAALESTGAIQLHVRIDERDAAFVALGIAKGERAAGLPPAPVAVVTTSGSAVANLHPAVIEAAYSSFPLLLLTADRPARLRGTGANQTIDDQADLLTGARASFDLPIDDADAAAAAALQAARIAVGAREEPGAGEAQRAGGAVSDSPGPVQLNVQFDLPLEPAADDPPFEIATPQPQGLLGAQVPFDNSFVSRAAMSGEAGLKRAVIVAGDAFEYGSQRVAEFADRTGLPILAEPTSALISHPHAVPAHARVLEAHPELAEQISDVYVFGKVTLFRPDAKLLNSARVHRIQSDLDAVAGDVWRAALDTVTPSATALQSWRGLWNEAAAQLPALAASQARSAAAAALRGAGEVFVASSSVVRYLAEAEVPTGVRVHASRGLAGIDGLVSTAIGLSLGLSAPVRLLIGDVALLHDVGGLLREAGETQPDVQIFVLNDDGGAIFAGLEHGQPHLRQHFPRFFGTRHGRTFADLAAAYGWDYELCTSTESIVAAARRGSPGIVEIPLPPVGG